MQILQIQVLVLDFLIIPDFNIESTSCTLRYYFPHFVQNVNASSPKNYGFCCDVVLYIILGHHHMLILG